MSNDTVVSLAAPARVCDPLTELLRTGARRLIEAAVTAEFEEYLSGFVQEKLPDGRQRVVRNGRRRAFLELRRPPFDDEFTRCHGVSHTELNAPWGHSAPPGTAPRPRSRRGFRPTNEPPICSCVGLEVEQLDAIAVTAKIPAIEGQQTPLAVGQHGRDDVRIVNLTTPSRHRAA